MDADWHVWLVVLEAVGIVLALFVIGWLAAGRKRCRQKVRQDATQHFVHGSLFVVMHRTMFPDRQVPIGVAFDPAQRDERDRVLDEWGAFDETTLFDLAEWEAAAGDGDGDRRTPFDDPETGEA